MSSISKRQERYMGLLRITPKSWAYIQNVLAKFSRNKRDKVSMTRMLQTVIKQSNLPVTGVPYQNEWVEIALESDLQEYNVKQNKLQKTC